MSSIPRQGTPWALLLVGLILAGCQDGQADPASSVDVAVANIPDVPEPLDPDQAAEAEAAAAGLRPGSLARVPANPAIPQEPSPFRFEDIAPGSGIDFVMFSGMTPEKHFPSANGSGLAIFDYDGDGRMDLYFATCTLLPLGTAEKGPNRLYRNLGDGTFRDVTEESGLGFAGFTHGVIAADLDNDGDQDVFLGTYGPNALFLNDGDGTFRDVSEAAGIDRDDWSSGGAPIDYDNDGDLDLYVSKYGEWKLPDDDQWCGLKQKGIRTYCNPKTVRTVRHILYRNDGPVDGVPHFTDVTEAAGVARADGHGFGVIAADLNGDNLTDLYVANDMNPNFLFLNKGDGTFDDAGDISGAAFDERGSAQSGMGADAEDVDGDGLPEIVVTNFAGEPNTLYQNLGGGGFYDHTAGYGLKADSEPWVGWGCGLVDFDNDGWPDLFVANGHVDDNLEDVPYAQPALLHRNVAEGVRPGGGRRFRLATRDVGPYFDAPHVGRGVAFGDLDDDGRIDIVVNHKDAAPAVLLNRTPQSGHWVRLKLVGTRSNRDAVGAKVVVEAGGRTLHRQRKGGTSLESSHDPRLLIGLGDAATIDSLTVRWPSGAESTLRGLKADAEYELVEPAADGQ